MILDNNISVIIPVYNAAPFVVKAVESALMQSEVAEVLLIEDGSHDNSLDICKQLAGQYKKVKLFTHANNVNKGAGASRNVGIKNAQYEFIAFLDADDYYLPDRFRAERRIFAEKPETDGVYGALGFHYYSEEARRKYEELGYSKLTTVSEVVPPKDLFLVFLGLYPPVHGYFHLDTLTLRHSVFSGKMELFNNLALHQDTVFVIQLAINCHLESGIIDEPIGMRGVHENNRIVDRSTKSSFLMWKTLFIWAKRTKKNKNLIRFLGNLVMSDKILSSNRIYGFFLLQYFCLKNRHFLQQRVTFNPSCLHVFKKYYGGYVIVAKERVLKKVFKWQSINSFNYATLLRKKN